MKKFLTIAIVLVMAFVLCSCGTAKVPTADEVKGTVNGSVYENGYFGLKFTINGDWYFLSSEEIAEVAGTTQNILAEAGNDIQDNVPYYDMMAMDENTGNNINIMVQVVGDAGNIDFDELLDESESEILSLGASIGATYSFSDHSTVKLSGVEFHKLGATAELYGITYEQGCYIALVDGVFANVTITSYDGTPISDIEAMFK